ncbi:MAG: DNA-directed RNA polymerase subunit beta', partial [Candidatus Marinimicrobia bacterium]|nr:DNA-directed RNA polymerase subunit beta' [Candidatus Neomarinimicrobiota bacterium]
ALEEVIEDKYVLLNRAPTLHRLGIQAFKPVLIEGKAIQVHPLVCSAFNADFDGDQMAVHVPLGEEAQEEARELMAATKNLLIPRTGDPVVNPSQDIVLGCYFMTRSKPGAKGEGEYFDSPNEAIMAYDFEKVDLQASVNVLVKNTPKYEKLYGEKGIIETTVGRLLFNSVLPIDFDYINEEFTKKSLVKMVDKLIRRYGPDEMAPMLDKIKDFGYQYSTRSGISWGMDDLIEPKEKKKIIDDCVEKDREIYGQFNEGLLTEDERYRKSIVIWQDAKKQVDEIVPPTLDQFGPVFSMVHSAARGSWDQINQMAGMKGLVMSPSGKIIDFPITSSYKGGLNVLEYFISTHGARKGTADTALKTAKAGYLTRRLVDVAQDVVVRKEDCKTKEGILMKKDPEIENDDIASRIKGRVLSQGLELDKSTKFKAGHLILSEEADLINEKIGDGEIWVRSPLMCETKHGLCQKCYGRDLGRGGLVKLGEAVGIIAAQAIGEPGTQLTMRTFHTGGIAARGGDITLGLPRVEELFEIRTPANSASIAEFDGVILDIEDDDPSVGSGKDKIISILPDEEGAIKTKKKTKKAGEKESKSYNVPFGKRIILKKGDKVKAGDQLFEGPIDPKALFKVAGKKRAQNYIMEEVGRVYAIQGVSVNEKHLETIVKQMFSRLKITNSGDTYLNVGNIVEKSVFLEENEKAKKEGREPATAKQLLMGISKVSLSTSSWLSSASFQDTARILITASIEGREDILKGLKENVIIGRLIPAGTGFRKDLETTKKHNQKIEQSPEEETS